MFLNKYTQTYRSVLVPDDYDEIKVTSESDMVQIAYNSSVFEMTLRQAEGIRDALTLIIDDSKKEIENNG